MADTPTINENTPVTVAGATVATPATTAQVANPAVPTPAPPAPAPAPKKMFAPPPPPEIDVSSVAIFRPDARVNPGPSIAQIAAEYLAQERANAQAKIATQATGTTAADSEAKKSSAKTSNEATK